MKKIPFIVFLIIVCINNYSQPLNRKNITYLAAFGKVWGFLKYYHPEVAGGKYNWDTVIVKNYESIVAVRAKQEFNLIISRVIESAGKISACKSCREKFPKEFYKQPDFSWIHDTSVFNSSVSAKLQYILYNYKPVSNYYVERNKNVGNPYFGNEKIYDVSLPSPEYRFLALCRFWNAIKYYYPYLYQVPITWESFMAEFIPRMSNIPTDYFYFRTIQEMASRINDGHAFVSSDLANMFENRRLLPFKIKEFNKIQIVSSYLDTVICNENSIKIGDTIIGIDGFNLNLLRKHHARYIASSNNTYLDSRVDLWMSVVKTNPASIKLLRGLDTIKLKIKTLATPYILKQKNKDVKPYFFINDSVGYIHLGKIKANHTDSMFIALKHTKFLIIDGRYYPNWTVYELAEKFLPDRTIVAQISEPDYRYPGYIKWVEPMYAGKPNKEYYKGKLILLINDETMSQGEITIMTLMKAPSAITIGTQTAGACGDVSSLPVPGGINISFSGLGYYFSDYSELQKKGIRPSIEVKTTISDLVSGKDAILERAMEYIKNGK
jgi:C-terminal processing protease CtpA/Prc